MRKNQMNVSAPGKLILCGEHAVVFGRPAIALPLSSLRAYASLTPGPAGSGLLIDAPDLARRWRPQGQDDDPLGSLALRTLERLALPLPDALLTLRSDIPQASGLGSGAAIGTALVRALAEALGATLPPEAVSGLVYESERFFHGTPSGIDNTVVAYERPVWFRRHLALPGDGEPPPPTVLLLAVAAPYCFVVADTGIRSTTRLPVGEVRRRWRAAPERFAELFDEIGGLALQARRLLEDGGPPLMLGRLLDQNQALLGEIGVSSPELDRLCTAARGAGALGAKLSGAGWGGVMLALTTPENAPAVATALHAGGAARVFTSELAAG